MSFWKELGESVAEVAPLLGGAIAGPGGAAIGAIVASVFGVDPADPKALEQAIRRDPDAVVKLRDIETRHAERLEELALQRHQANLNAETERHAQSQATIRTEAEHGTRYVKETRPRIARLSGYATIAYVLVAEAARLITDALGMPIVGAQEAVALVLFSPCGTYMTMRSLDGFSKAGRS